ARAQTTVRKGADRRALRQRVGVGLGAVDVDPLAKRATVRTLSNGGLCSGALVNNTAVDETPYVLTAWHCGQTSNTVFRFNYQTAGCGSGGAPTNQQMSGCTVLASNQASDGRLLRINNAVPINYQPYYAPWFRGTANPTTVYSMHHPNGSPKKFSFDGNGAFKQNGSFPGIGTVPCWRADFNFGGVSGGSSGGPLFDGQDRIRGFLTGGPGASCPTVGLYGRLDRFWNNVNIAQYLDPLNIGENSVEGFDPLNPDGGPTNPVIDAVVPSQLATVEPDQPVSVELQGTGFLGASSVTIDGDPVFALQIVDDNTITFNVLPPFELGTKTIEVTEGIDVGSIDIDVVHPGVPRIDLVNSVPGVLITFNPMQVYLGSEPGDVHFLLVSLSDQPTTVPGLLDIGIGNNATNLFVLGDFVVDPVNGFTLAEFPLLGLAGGTTFYLQSVVFSAASPGFPLEASNIEVGAIFI
ncbi:MAG: hypothetical protein AAFZ65_20795, partial [Planctomycetota bacterium]